MAGAGMTWHDFEDTGHNAQLDSSAVSTAIGFRRTKVKNMKEPVVLAAFIVAAATISTTQNGPCFQIRMNAHHAFIIDTTTGNTREKLLSDNEGSSDGYCAFF